MSNVSYITNPKILKKNGLKVTIMNDLCGKGLVKFSE